MSAPLNQLRQDLKELVGQSLYDEVFRLLKEEVLQSNCELYNDTIVVQSRYSDSKRAGHLGTIDFKEKNQQFNNVSYALVWLIDRVALGNLSDAYRQRLENPRHPLPGYHAFACDRVDQMDTFERFRANFLPGSRHFFYLYGGDLQAHRSFFARVSHELEGAYQQPDPNSPAPDPSSPVPNPDSQPPDPQPRRRALQIPFAVDECRDPQVLRERFVRNLFTAFGVSPENFHPLVHQNVGTLLQHSAKARALGPQDYVCVFVHISHWAWNKSLTPQAAAWFVETFCTCPLRPDSPALLFFFAFDHDEEMNPGVRQEVLDAVEGSLHLQGLPELDMVLRKDVALWLVRYQHLFPSAEQRKQILIQRFPTPQYVMEDIETQLQKLLDETHDF